MNTLRDRLENWGQWSNTVRKDAKKIGAQIDAEDARTIFQAMERIAPPHAKMLVCAFVSMMTPDEICRRLEILPRPASNFVEAFRNAEKALERQLKVSGS